MVMSYIDIIEVILSDLRDICAGLVENLLKCRILQNLALQGLQNIQKLTEICACGEVCLVLFCPLMTESHCANCPRLIYIGSYAPNLKTWALLIIYTTPPV